MARASARKDRAIPDVTSWRTWEFKSQLSRLPPNIQRLAEKNFQLWKTQKNHPSLNWELLHIEGDERVWSVRIGIGYRAVCFEKESMYVWFWVGSKEDFKKDF